MRLKEPQKRTIIVNFIQLIFQFGVKSWGMVSHRDAKLETNLMIIQTWQYLASNAFHQISVR